VLEVLKVARLDVKVQISRVVFDVLRPVVRRDLSACEEGEGRKTLLAVKDDRRGSELIRLDSRLLNFRRRVGFPEEQTPGRVSRSSRNFHDGIPGLMSCDQSELKLSMAMDSKQVLSHALSNLGVAIEMPGRCLVLQH
jgi:hypothetical protein